MPRGRPSNNSEARSEILHVRLAPAERERLRAAAEAEYIDQSAWARRAILQALDTSEAQATRPRQRGKG